MPFFASVRRLLTHLRDEQLDTLRADSAAYFLSRIYPGLLHHMADRILLCKDSYEEA